MAEAAQLEAPAQAHAYVEGALKWLIALAVILCTILEVLDSSIVNVALPHMQGSFSASKSSLLASRGAHGYKAPFFSTEFVRDHAETKKNLKIMDSVGTDVQFLSPRPYQLMHGETPAAMVEP